ncbi:MAG TPA: UTP--glucose-1-phosphate uridylyltransferase [Dehalococcoidia bacterium]|nr:UTP--glucose-1-phosphate uridylyltransferase [Dehalococcoidia bacterium]
MASRIRKAIILAAGYGTRFLPETKSVPKEMLPIVDRPVIQYIVEEALASGLDQIVIVTAMAKRAIEDHFDRNLELEAALANKPDFLESVRSFAGVDIAFVRQKEMKGQSHAILSARNFVGDESFALFYPDDVIFGDQPVIGQLLDVREKHGGSVIAVQQCTHEDIVHYGAIDADPVEDRVWKVNRIVEKPAPCTAPSLLGTVGRYVVSGEMWPLLEKTPPSIGGEMFFTDTMAMYMEQGGLIHACEYRGDRFDTGRPIGLLKASLYAALRRPDIAPELEDYLRTLSVPA